MLISDIFLWVFFSVVYEKHIRCVQDQHEAAYNCSRPQIESFRRKISAKSAMEVMILSSCS